MIRNEQQLHIAKTQAGKFRRTLEEFDDSQEAHLGVHPTLITAQREAIASQLESLELEIAEFEQRAES